MKAKKIIFIGICLVVCLLPFVGMFFHPTTQTTENKKMAEMPSLRTEEGGLNTSFFSQFETYFQQHMMLRNELITADADIMSGLFGQSNVSGVIAGSDGWLYYSSTLDDYLGNSRMSEEELAALAHNLSVVQQYLDEKGVQSLWMIPPNKNTLYGEHMPYYADVPAENGEHNAVRLAPLLEQKGVRYCDLFALFEEQEEILYQKRDSHWNDQGAVLVYNTTLERLGIGHDDIAPTGTRQSAEGDLNRMLYSFYGTPETVPAYDIPMNYTEGIPNSTVESGWYTTVCDSGSGTLLMFRDSFGNSLIPLYSNVFAQGYYSKGQPHMLEMYMELYDPDVVMIEKVERNIGEYLTDPPVLTAPQTPEPSSYTMLDAQGSGSLCTVSLTSYENSDLYYCLKGRVDDRLAGQASNVLVKVNGVCRIPYRLQDGSFVMYLKKEALPDGAADLRVFVEDGEETAMVFADTVSCG